MPKLALVTFPQSASRLRTDEIAPTANGRVLGVSAAIGDVMMP